MRFPKLLLIASACILFATTTRLSHSQSLEELKMSEVYRKFDLEQSHSHGGLPPGNLKKREALSNYETLWANSIGAKLLLDWIDARVPNHRLMIMHIGLKADHASAEAQIIDQQRITIWMTIKVPMPAFKDMAKHRTLASFNRFRPPTLDTVGEQKIDVQGIQSEYFRHKKGECSLLIPTEQMGMVNLMVSSCIESEALFKVANSLNFKRLNFKLMS